MLIKIIKNIGQKYLNKQKIYSLTYYFGNFSKWQNEYTFLISCF